MKPSQIQTNLTAAAIALSEARARVDTARADLKAARQAEASAYASLRVALIMARRDAE